MRDRGDGRRLNATQTHRVEAVHATLFGPVAGQGAQDAAQGRPLIEPGHFARRHGNGLEEGSAGEGGGHRNLALLGLQGTYAVDDKPAGTLHRTNTCRGSASSSPCAPMSA